MYCVDVYEFNVVVDMETGGKVPSDQLQGLVIDGKKYKHYDEIMVSASGYPNKNEAIAFMKKYEGNKRLQSTVAYMNNNKGDDLIWKKFL